MSIQIKRMGLCVRRFFRRLGQFLRSTLQRLAGIAFWFWQLPARIIAWLWTSLFWPVEESARTIGTASDWATRTNASPDPDLKWKRTRRFVDRSRSSIQRSTRLAALYVRRAGRYSKRAFENRTAWTWATVTGTLGILLMLILQLLYFFQPLTANEAPPPKPVTHSVAKTRIDPAFPQVRPAADDEPVAIAQIDPFAPAEPDPFAPPVESPSPPMEQPQNDPPPQPEEEPFHDPLDNLPPLEPNPPHPPENDPPFVDPLDNLPPMEPIPEPPPPPLGNPFNPVDPPVENVPKSLGPFDDPLDQLPPSEPDGLEWTIERFRIPAESTEKFLVESENRPQEVPISPLARDAWERYLGDRDGDPFPKPAYWDRLSSAERAQIEENFFAGRSESQLDEPPSIEKAENLTVAIEKSMPETTTENRAFRYEIVVENNGNAPLERVEIDEAIPPVYQLIDASPPGYFAEDLLRWHVSDLRPGESRTFSVEVIPSKTGIIETATSARVAMEIGSSTDVEREVERPVTIRLRRFGYRSLSWAEIARYTNFVENTSGRPERNLEIVERVPTGYRVLEVEDGGVYDRESGTITWRIAELLPGATVKLGVRIKAESEGEVISRIRASGAIGDAVPILARVQVEQSQAKRPRMEAIRRVAHEGDPRTR